MSSSFTFLLSWLPCNDGMSAEIKHFLTLNYFSQSILSYQQEKKLGCTWYKCLDHMFISMTWILTPDLPCFTKYWGEQTGHCFWMAHSTSWATLAASGIKGLEVTFAGVGVLCLYRSQRTTWGKRSSLLPSWWPQRLNSVCEAWWQVLVPTEIPHRLGKTPLYLLSKAKWKHINQLQYI